MRKFLSVIASTLIQCLVIAVLLVSPMLFTEGVPRLRSAAANWLPPPPEPPTPPAPERPVHGGSGPSFGTSVTHHFTTDAKPSPLNFHPTGPAEDGPSDLPNLPTGIGAPTGPGIVGSVWDSVTNTSYRRPPPPPPVTPPQAVPQRIHIATIDNAKILSRPQPVYPPLARQARIQGLVRLEAIISKEGRIEDLRVASGHPLLVQAALDAVQQWRYKPLLLNGQPVEVITTIEVNFTLNQ